MWEIFLVLSFIGLLCWFFLIEKNGEESISWAEKVIFLLDTSESMNVTDMWRKSRLESSKINISEILERSVWYSFALNIFAGETQRIIPFTTDREIFLTLLSGVSSKSISKWGSDMLKGLEDSLDHFWENRGTLIVYSDGHEKELQLSASLKEKVKTQSISIFFIGVGQEEKSPIPGIYYQWRQVYSGLQASVLQKLAKDVSGVYLDFWEEFSLWEKKSFGGMDSLIYLSCILWLAFCILFLRKHYG